MFSGRENRFRLGHKATLRYFSQGRIPLKFVRIMPLGLAKLNQKDYFCAATLYTAAHRRPPILKTQHFIYVQAAL